MDSPKTANIGLHSGAFTLLFIANGLFLSSLIYPQWAIRTNPQQEIVSSVKLTAGIFERCSYFPTGHLECMPMYPRDHQFVTSIKALAIISVASLFLALIMTLLGGNCTNCLYQEHKVNPIKQKMLLFAGIFSFIAFVLTLVICILFAVEINSQTIFGNLVTTAISADIDNAAAVAVVSTGSSLILGAITCGLSFLAAGMLIMAGVVDVEGDSIEFQPYSNTNNQYNPVPRDYNDAPVAATRNNEVFAQNDPYNDRYFEERKDPMDDYI